MIQRRVSRAIAGIAVLVVAACSDSTRPVVPESIAATTGNGQAGQVGSAILYPLQVTVTGSDRRPFAGATVRWRVTSGTATVQPDSSVTDVNGIAEAAVSLGRTAGAVTVTGTVEGVDPATFTLGATAGAPAFAYATSSSSGQSGVVGAALPNRVRVQVQDRFGNVVPGVEVAFAAGNGGSMEPASATTDPGGYAQSTWTLGRAAGGQEATVVVPRLTTITVTASAVAGPPATLAGAGGDGQRGRPGSVLPLVFEVLASDSFQNPVPGATVTWAVTGGGGTLSDATSQTGPNGTARTRLTLGAAEGPNTVTATVGSARLSFTATAIHTDSCNAPAVLATGAGVTGELSAPDCLRAAGEYVDYHVFQPRPSRP